MAPRARPYSQTELFDARPTSGEPAAPEGFDYWPDAIPAGFEARLAREIEALPFKPFEFRGYLGARRTVSFGLRYDYERRKVEPASAPPEILLRLRDQVARLAGLEPEALMQALVSEYAPGAGIGWHRDRPQFGEVIGVSLVSPCVLRFRREAGAKWSRASAPLAVRSAYRLRGPARDGGQHSIVPMHSLRYSVTVRTLA